MKAKGEELEFISQIGRDGLSIKPVTRADVSHMDNDWFVLMNLSLTAKTFIACGFNSFVVKLKK